MTLVRDGKTLLCTLMTLVAVWIASTGTAVAAVRFDGTWPDADRAVSLRAEQVTRQQALHLLGEATGWSILAADVDDDVLDLAIKDQPAAKVLDMILSDADYVANRDGDRVTVARGALAATDSTPQPPPIPETPSMDNDESFERGGDRHITGGDLRIDKHERVGDVTVRGGHVEVFGVVEGDVDVQGGGARLHEGSHVRGDVTVRGGEVAMASGSRVDGDVHVTGGTVHREPGSFVGGSVSDVGGHSVATESLTSDAAEAWTFAGMVDDITWALTRTSLLFLFGAIVWALAMQRMEMLEVEIAKRPMRSLALGVVGALTAAFIAVVLVVTVLGIPFAAVGVIVTVAVSYMGACVVLSTIGQALLRHRTKNRYIHLALGCLLFLLFTSIPYVGTFVWLGVLLIGLGAVVATRGMGMVPVSTNGHGPYRTAAV